MSDYFWEKTGTNTIVSDCDFIYHWELFVGSYLDEELNVVEFHIDDIEWSQNSWNLVLGLCSEGHSRKTSLGSNQQVSSRESKGWGFIANGFKNHENSAGAGIPYSNPTRLKSGDCVRMVFNAFTKSVSFELNEVDLGEAFSNVEGRVRIAASTTCKHLRLRIQKSTSSGILIEKITEEERERLDYVIQNLGQVEVPLKNKTIKLWKPFLRFQNHQIKDLRHYSLRVEERIIFYLLLSKETEIRRECLVDYFIFYKILGVKCPNMKHQMFNVMTKTNRLSFEDLFFCLKDIALRFENKNIQSWFTSSENQSIEEEEKEIEEFRFDHAFTLWIFNRMKYTIKGIEKGSERYNRMIQYDRMNIILQLLENFEITKVIGGDNPHSDFKNCDLEVVRRSSIKRMNEILWRKKVYHNVVLETLDGGKFKSHIEHLVFQYNFFHRMLRFGGKESKSLKESGTILLEHMEREEVNGLLEFSYTEEISTRDLRTLILLYLHGDRFKEKGLMTKTRKILEENIEFYESEEIRKVVTEFGYLLDNISNLRPQEEEEDVKICQSSPLRSKNSNTDLMNLLTLFSRKIGDNEMKKLIRKSDEKMEVQIVIHSLQKKVENQEDIINQQNEEIRRLRSEVETNKKDIEELKTLFRSKSNQKKKE